MPTYNWRDVQNELFRLALERFGTPVSVSRLPDQVCTFVIEGMTGRMTLDLSKAITESKGDHHAILKRIYEEMAHGR